MPRKRKDEEQNRVPALKGTTYYAPTDAYHQDALDALSSGAYGKQHMAQRRAAEYQKNLADEQKKYSYNQEAAKNNTLEKADKSFGLGSFGLESSDHDYLQRIYDRYGDSELTRRSLRESNQTKDWERKYGKSYDQIYEDFLADQGNVKMEMGENHPFLTEIGTVLNSIPTAAAALPSLYMNIVNPDNPMAKNYEKIRAKKSEENKYWRAGVKENTGETGDKAIDMLNSIADRVAVTSAGKLAGTALGGPAAGEVLGSGMAGLSEANQRMDELNLRPELSARQKALTALGHGAIEGAGTALVGGWLDKIPGAKNFGGALVNLGKGAFEGAAENAVSEILHNTLDTTVNKDQSQKELTKAIYMAQGMSEEEAENLVREEQASGVKTAALTGAGFGAGMRGLSVGAKKLIPSLFDPEYGKVETYKIYEPDENAKAPASGEAPKTNIEQPKVEAPVEQPKVEQPVVEPTPEVNTPKAEVPEVKPNQGTYEIPTDNRVPEMKPEGGDQLSQHYYTLKNSDMFQTSETKMKMLEEAKEKGTFNKGVESRLKAREDALRAYIKDPELAKQQNMNKQWDSGKDIDTSMLIMHDALENGDQAEFNLTALKQTEELKGAAREMRASRDYSGTREGTLVKGVEYLNDKADAVLKSKKTKTKFENIANQVFDGDYSGLADLGMDDVNINNIREAIERGANKDTIVKMMAMHKAVGATQISADTIMKVNDIYNEIEARGLNPTSRARAQLEADAYKILAQDIGGRRTAKDMWNAWRYLAMLGNPKTHLRNILGNTTHYMVTEVKDNIAAVIEEAVDKANRAAGGEGIDRTKARLTGEDNGLVEMSAQDADDVAYAMLNDSGNKYVDVKGEINRARNSFNNKALSKVDEFNSNLLDMEDYTALKRKYSKSLARFLKANGADEDIFYATDDASKALLDKGRAYAIDQAKQATFHEYSKMAEALTQFSQKLSEGNAAAKVGGAMVEGLVPFKKTPINILKQAVKYSPVSFAKGLGKMFDAVKTGNSSASDAIEDFASGLTGTGIMALGYFLAHEGYLTGGQDADWDVDNAESEQGKQNYALKIGNKSYTLDWLAPMSLPLFVGAELYKLFDSKGDDDADTVDKVISALSTIAEPVTEMSMLQGIQNSLNELSYSRENILGTFASNATLGYASQGVPTLAGQVARAIDPYRRSTYSDQPSGFKRQFDKTMQKTLNKIPFLSMAQQPYIDYKGNMQETQGVASSLLGNNFGTRLIDQMASPGYYKEGNITPLDSELNRLYQKTGIDVYPNVASGTVDDQRLDKEKFTRYQTLYGQNTDKFLNAFIESDGYNEVDDQTKAETINSIKGFAKKIADYEVGGKALGSKTDQDLYNIYKKEGAQGVANYYNDKAKAESLGLTYDTYMKKEAEAPGSAAQYAKDKETAVSLGFVQKDGSPNTDRYEKAVATVGNEVPALQSYLDYQSQEFSSMDQKIPYVMDNNSFTDEQKGKLITDTVDPSKLNGKVVTDMYNMGGYEGVYYWYVLKYLADQYGDQNGYVKKDEKNALLNSNDPYVQKLSDEMYYYLADVKW